MYGRHPRAGDRIDRLDVRPGHPAISDNADVEFFHLQIPFMALITHQMNFEDISPNDFVQCMNSLVPLITYQHDSS